MSFEQRLLLVLIRILARNKIILYWPSWGGPSSESRTHFLLDMHTWPTLQDSVDNCTGTSENLARHMHKSNSTFLLVPHVPQGLIPRLASPRRVQGEFSGICINPTVRFYLFLTYQGPHCKTGFTLAGFSINFQAHLWIQSGISVNPTVHVYLFLAYQGPHCNTGLTLAYLSVWASLWWGVPMPYNAAMPLFCDQSAMSSCTLFHTKKHHSSHKIFASRFTRRCVLAYTVPNNNGAHLQ